MTRAVAEKKGESEVRGARDLVALWSELPAATLIHPLQQLPAGLGLLEIGNGLRASAWRERCAAGRAESCVDRLVPCMHANTGGCRADVLVPVHPGGGAPQWRMATLTVQWRPAAEELRLLAVGRVACEELTWAAHVLAARHGLASAKETSVRRLGDLMPGEGRAWQLNLGTPWLVSKFAEAPGRQSCSVPSAEDVARKLHESLCARAHKLTALCTGEPLWQRIGGHLARYASEAVLARGLAVRRTRLVAVRIDGKRIGRGKPYDGLAWAGEVELEVDEPVLPWLALLDAFGVGENTDKGFGQVELLPLRD